jgi:hypothetical protein
MRCHALQRIQPIGLGNWKLPEEDVIDDAEDGRVRTNAKRQGDQRDSEKAGTVQEGPPSVADILEQLVDQLRAPHVATLLFSLLEAAHRAHRSIASFVGRHALRDVRFDSPFNVVAELIVEFLLDLIAAEHRPNTQRQRGGRTQQAHVYTCFNRITREIAADSRSQFNYEQDSECCAEPSVGIFHTRVEFPAAPPGFRERHMMLALER